MNWRKIRLLWPLGLAIGLLGSIAIQIFRSGHELIAVVIGLFLAIRALQFVQHFSRMQPEQVAAEEENMKEIWLIIPGAIAIQVMLVIGWEIYSGPENPDLRPLPYISFAILVPATFLALFRSVRRSRRAKRAATERIERENTRSEIQVKPSQFYADRICCAHCSEFSSSRE